MGEYMGTSSRAIMKVLILVACLAAVAFAQPRNQLTCDICTDIMTDLDNFITSDTTEQEIIDFVKEICHALGQLISGFEATCNLLVTSQLPAKDLLTTTWTPLRSALTFWEPVLKNLSTKIQKKKICFFFSPGKKKKKKKKKKK